MEPIQKTDLLRYAAPVAALIILFAVFYPKHHDEEGYAPRDYAEIAESGILRAVTEYDAISYHAEGDTVTGFHYELLKAFADSRGLQMQMTPVMSFAERLDGVLSGQYDILAHSTPVTTELRDTLLFTHPIQLSKLVLVQRRPESENDTLQPIHTQLDLAGKTLYLPQGSPAQLRIHNLSNEIGDSIHIREVERYGSEQLLAMVAHGDIDYAVCDEAIARAAQADFPNLDLRTAVSFTQFYAWGVSEASPALRDTLNTWLEGYMKTPAYRALKKKYFH
jgi:ABC-type amino acid transport substrate-binding protein